VEIQKAVQIEAEWWMNVGVYCEGSKENGREEGKEGIDGGESGTS
jgi:hypothetical protein